MPSYKSYPKVKDTPNRTARKHARKTLFWENKFLNNEIRKARRIAKKKAEEEAARKAKEEADFKAELEAEERNNG